MTGDAFGRHLECYYYTYSDTLWPNNKYCRTDKVDYSAKFEAEKHSFYVTYPWGFVAQKSEINTFYIYASPQVHFIPLDILTEFPKLNALMLSGGNLPTLKSGLFKEELKKIEYLNLEGNEIESIEPEAFQYLVNLRWIRLDGNKIQSLPDQIFKSNPDLIYISFYNNKINSIHPSFFDGLQKLKLIEFTDNGGCINDQIGCETCLITQAELRGKLQGCFDNCSNGTTCLTSHLAHLGSQTTEIPQTTTENPIESNSTEKVVEGIEELIDCQLGDFSQNFTASLRDTQMAVEGVKQELSDLKTLMETNNQNMQKCCTSNQKAVEELTTKVENMPRIFEKTVETQFKTLKMELALMVQEKLDALQDRLENNGG
jgi:hypothetical protein